MVTVPHRPSQSETFTEIQCLCCKFLLGIKTDTQPLNQQQDTGHKNNKIIPHNIQDSLLITTTPTSKAYIDLSAITER